MLLTLLHRPFSTVLAARLFFLCLPAHTTHLLQPLDVGVFAPLATAYKNHVHRVTRLEASYSIDKVDFLELYQQARQDAITPVIIQKAWQKAGFLPFHPELILERYPAPKQLQQYNITIRPTTPPEATVTYSGPDHDFEVALTPANTTGVQRLLQRATEGAVMSQILQKVGKAAKRAMAESTIQNVTNSELLELNRRKTNKRKWAKGNYGVARYLGKEVVEQRNEDIYQQQYDREWNHLLH